MSKDIVSLIKTYATFPQTGVTLRQMVQFGKRPKESTLFRSSLFLADELAIRIAHRAAHLESAPFGLSEMPSIIKVRKQYEESFRELVNFPVIKLSDYLKEKYKPEKPIENLRTFGIKREYCKDFDPEDEKWLPIDMGPYTADFVSVIDKIKFKHGAVVPTIAQGVLEWKAQNSHAIIHKDIHKFLDSFYTSRIGIRSLIGQHVSLFRDRFLPNHVGIINTKTDCKKTIQDAVDNARFICEQNYGLFSAPKVLMYCSHNDKVRLDSKDIEFMYIPSHLNHMVFELVKNSMRAVVETHGADSDTSPPIRIIIAEGNEDITIKISDEGGGIPRSGVPLLFTYLYTTASSPMINANLDSNMQQNDYRAPMAGYGYGLPLSRLYARYFGGDLKLISMEGFGTDTYLHLSRLCNHQEPLY